MQPCNRIYYSTVHWRLNMFRAAYRSSSGALTVFAASGLHKHVVTGRSQVWVGTQFWVHWRLNMFRAAYSSSSGALTVFAASGLHTHVVTGGSPHAYVNQRLQIQLELERWNNKFYYKVGSCWYFYWALFSAILLLVLWVTPIASPLKPHSWCFHSCPVFLPNPPPPQISLS